MTGGAQEAVGEPGRVEAERSRLVPLVGCRNFRDLGGYPTADGRRVRWARVYRSDTHSELTDEDRDELHRRRVRVVVDLRRPYEIEARPSAVAADPRFDYRHLPISDGEFGWETLSQRMRSGEVTELGVREVTAYYVEQLETHGPTFGAVLRSVLEAGREGAVFHCAAGKDRTGMSAALLLGALGVEDGHVLDDYELTNEYRQRERIEQLRVELAGDGIDVDRFLPLLTAHRDVLVGALAAVRAAHGSVEGYLRDAAGLDDAELGALRDALLEG